MGWTDLDKPVSLLNQDCKFFDSILVKTLEQILPEIRSTGIKHHQTQDSIRRTSHVIHVLNYEQRKQPKWFGWRKSFRFSKLVIFKTLHRFHFHKTFIQTIQLFLFRKKKKQKKNSENYNKWLPSGSFELERCWHQGCPISPLLFTLFVEPLSQLIRQNHEVHGVSLAGDHKIALFADDVLIYLTCPAHSLPALLPRLTEFWSVSGYKGNSSKSQLLTTSQQFRDNHAIREVEYEIWVSRYQNICQE